MDADAEQYVLLVLADGNLPTGSFVASSGLESYVTHGFFSNESSQSSKGATEETINFIRQNLESYSHTAIAFVTDAHTIVSRSVWQESVPWNVNLEACLKQLAKLDAFYDAITLNHVAGRASKAQGVALLTLFSRGFSKPGFIISEPNLPTKPTSLEKLVSNFKLEIRRGKTHGHLPVCWGILTAALGISVERSRYLHLFLHARGLLSAAIRMNVIGPYAAQQLLLHVVRSLVETQIVRCEGIRTGVPLQLGDLEKIQPEQPLEVIVDGPANTWPLGEILTGRHDLQHSRIFNS